MAYYLMLKLVRRAEVNLQRIMVMVRFVGVDMGGMIR